MALGYGYQSIVQWRRTHTKWAEDLAAAKKGSFLRDTDFDIRSYSFPEFVKRYFGVELARHQLEVAAALDDTTTTKKMVMGFPEAGKSTVVGLFYLIYRICVQPDIRILLIVKSKPKAADMMERVKRYLTQEWLYAETEGNLIIDMGGFMPAPGSGIYWTKDHITIRQRRSGERDPTLNIVGVKGHVYGSRLDLIIMDDALDNENQLTDNSKDNINRWFISEVTSRVQRGEIIISCTRLRPDDLYGRWIRQWKNDEDFRLVKIPAILNEYTDEEESNWPGRFPLDDTMVWDEERQKEIKIKGMRTLRRQQKALSPDSWDLVYQQKEIEAYEAVFRNDPHIQNCYTEGAAYSIGQVEPHERLILGVDPATRGRAAAVLIAYDPSTHIRRVVDLYVGAHLGTHGIRQALFYDFWEKYMKHGIEVTAVEVNFVQTLMGDEHFRSRAQMYGSRLVEHKTFGSNVRGRRGAKWDEEYGIGALAPKMANQLFAFAGRTVEDRRQFEPLIHDMLHFPYEDPPGDALVALWVADTAVSDIREQGSIPQETRMAMSGVPPYLIKQHNQRMAAKLARKTRSTRERLVEGLFRR